MKKAMQRSRMQKAFTLLETLLALSLTVLLICASTATLTLYGQYRIRGLEGMRQSKVIHGTLADLQSDLKACYSSYDPALITVDTGRDTSLTSPSSTVGEEQFLAFSAQQKHPIRLVGRSNAILLTRQSVNARFYWSEQNPIAKEYQILWLAPNTQSIRLPACIERFQAFEQDFRVPKDLNPKSPALFRCSIPLTDSWKRPSGSYTSSNSDAPSWEKNEEVHQLEFRYFDGTYWQTEWNSHQQNNRLPSAIEVRVSFVGSTEQLMRFVIEVPQ